MSAREARVGLVAYISRYSWDWDLNLPDLQAKLNAYRDAIIAETQREDAQRIREHDKNLCYAQGDAPSADYWADLIDPDKEN